ncbi:MAG: DUF4292 domain-containing protein [Flavobacterium sp.]|nr:DUF4292 domain-containing protein [Flavobacterium sp.]
MKKLFFLLLTLFIFSCKSKQALTGGIASKDATATKIIQEHYKNRKDFKTLNIRATTKYKDQSQSYAVSTEIRIKKDEMVWVYVKMLGFPVAKALITPNKVSYYEKLNNTYFEGDFKLISNWIGTDLDFNKVQNLFLGIAIDDLSKIEYVSKIENELYFLTEKTKTDFEKTFYFEAENFLLKKEFVQQPSQNRNLEIQYPSHQKENDIFLPNAILIKAIQKDQINIDIFYKNISFNEELNFSFSIPDGYEAVQIE